MLYRFFKLNVLNTSWAPGVASIQMPWRHAIPGVETRWSCNPECIFRFGLDNANHLSSSGRISGAKPRFKIVRQLPDYLDAAASPLKCARTPLFS
jgi:hypothetical protein